MNRCWICKKPKGQPPEGCNGHYLGTSSDPSRTRNSEVLKDFVKYCEEHPELRFWQALQNWVGKSRIRLMKGYPLSSEEESVSPYYWEGKDK